MRYQGKITEWNDDRGFGFVTANGTGERYFFHISELRGSSSRPAAGTFVTFEVAHQPGKRPCAVEVRYPGVAPPRRLRVGRAWGWTPDAMIAAAQAAVPVWLVASGKLPAAVLTLIGVMSVVAFVMYNVDKRRAERDARRIPEKLLQLLGLAGGWLGALCAQRVFRHKSSKPSYVRLFRLCGALPMLGMVWAMRPEVAALLNAL